MNLTSYLTISYFLQILYFVLLIHTLFAVSRQFISHQLYLAEAIVLFVLTFPMIKYCSVPFAGTVPVFASGLLVAAPANFLAATQCKWVPAFPEVARLSDVMLLYLYWIVINGAMCYFLTRKNRHS